MYCRVDCSAANHLRLTPAHSVISLLGHPHNLQKRVTPSKNGTHLSNNLVPAVTEDNLIPSSARERVPEKQSERTPITLLALAA
ncbi:hypothetical protein PM082_015241 [Marasmius tenuissimus]|nr:hypothetical protein PM082_015241 [Marasmius tenuissimus]